MCLGKSEMFVALVRNLVGMCIHSALYVTIDQAIKLQNTESKPMSTHFLNIMQGTVRISKQTFQVVPHQDYNKPYRLWHFHRMASFSCVFVPIVPRIHLCCNLKSHKSFCLQMNECKH